jgi:hypothetical protein
MYNGGMRNTEQKLQHAAYQKTWYDANRQKVSDYMRVYFAKHREERRAYNKAWRDAHAGELKAYRKKYNDAHRAEFEVYRRTHREERKIQARIRRYGLSQVEFDSLLKKQGGRCAICKTEDWNGKGPHIDHDHKTGKVRGVLCSNCNAAVGMVKDDLKIARGLAKYIRTWTEE